MDSAPSSSTVTRTVLLLLRVLSFVFLLIALILIAITKDTEDTSDGSVEFKFKDVHAYRYMLSTIVIGFAYNLLQMALSIFSVVSGKRSISSDAGYLFDFFGDKIISYFLISGSAAGFGASEDMHSLLKSGLELPFNSFFEKANASAGLLLIGFLCTAIASIFTSMLHSGNDTYSPPIGAFESSLADTHGTDQSLDVIHGTFPDSIEKVPQTPPFEPGSTVQSGKIEIVLPFEEEQVSGVKVDKAGEEFEEEDSEAEAESVWSMDRSVGSEVEDEDDLATMKKAHIRINKRQKKRMEGSKQRKKDGISKHR